ncbi:MAG: endonuclease III [Rhodospirillales bacterium]|nr:endonuclease III [Rhodospirillales bacterium]
MTPEQIDQFYARLAEAMPNPRSELEFHNPYTLLVAVVLSAQSTDAGVNRATRGLFAVADSPGRMLALGEDGLKRHISSIGLYNNKARNIIALSRILVDHHGGEVPHSRADLEALPGVGRKTANVVLNVAFGEPVIAVDTHAFRVANRTGLAPGETPLEVEQKLDQITPARWKHDAHHWLILHGRYVCKARRPECPRCVVRELCAFPAKTTTAELAAEG